MPARRREGITRATLWGALVAALVVAGILLVDAQVQHALEVLRARGR